jgi:hypothetical protein
MAVTQVEDVFFSKQIGASFQGHVVAPSAVACPAMGLLMSREFGALPDCPSHALLWAKKSGAPDHEEAPQSCRATKAALHAGWRRERQRQPA